MSNDIALESMGRAVARRLARQGWEEAKAAKASHRGFNFHRIGQQRIVALARHVGGERMQAYPSAVLAERVCAEEREYWNELRHLAAVDGACPVCFGLEEHAALCSYHAASAALRRGCGPICACEGGQDGTVAQ